MLLTLDHAGLVDNTVWLELSQAGLSTHPLSQVIDHPPTERKLAARLGLAETQRILSVFRAGRSAKTAESHRLI